MTYDRKLFIEAARRIPEYPTIIHIPEELMEPTVTPNPNEDAHRGLKKVIRLIERAKDKLHGQMEGQKTFKSDDPRVQMLVDLAEAQGLVEGYMLGEEWKEKYYAQK